MAVWLEPFSDVQPYRRRSLQAVLEIVLVTQNVSIFARYQLLEVGTMASASEVLILAGEIYPFAICTVTVPSTNVTNVTRLTN